MYFPSKIYEIYLLTFFLINGIDRISLILGLNLGVIFNIFVISSLNTGEYILFNGAILPFITLTANPCND